MLVLCVIFALLTVGFVVPCAIDVAMTPRRYFDLPSKQTWLIVVVAFWAFGAAVWLLVGRREAQMRRLWDDMTASWMIGGERPRRTASWPSGNDYPFGHARRGRQAAPAAARFVAPDDNPDFLLELDRRIRDWREEEA
jgi:hypothetical protein